MAQIIKIIAIVFILASTFSCSKSDADNNQLILHLSHLPQCNVQEKWYDLRLYESGELITRSYINSTDGEISIQSTKRIVSQEAIDAFQNNLSKIVKPKDLFLMGHDVTSIQAVDRHGRSINLTVSNPSKGPLLWSELKDPYEGQDEADDSARMDLLNLISKLLTIEN